MACLLSISIADICRCFLFKVKCYHLQTKSWIGLNWIKWNAITNKTLNWFKLDKVKCPLCPITRLYVWHNRTYWFSSKKRSRESHFLFLFWYEIIHCTVAPWYWICFSDPLFNSLNSRRVEGNVFLKWITLQQCPAVFPTFPGQTHSQ